MTGMSGIRSAFAAALGGSDDAARPNPAAGAAPTADVAAAATADASLLALVDRLTALLERSDLAELEVRAGGTALVLRKAGAGRPVDAVPAGAAVPGADGIAGVPHDASSAGRSSTSDEGRGAPAATEPEGTGRPVHAPLTGIFYGSPSPTAPAFVKVGQQIVVGQVIGLIEAMKLFNEIKSDRAGRVSRVVAASGALVKAKQPLIEVEPL